MASVRLTQGMRDSILHELLGSKFSEADKLLKGLLADLSDTVYRDVYDTDEIERMNGLPEGWLPDSNYMYVQFGDPDGYTRLTFRERRRFPRKHVNGCAKQYHTAHNLSTRWRAYQTDKERLKKNKKELMLEIRAVLNSVSTLSKLIEAWPEIHPFMEKLKLGSPIARLPAVRMDELNKALNLPIQLTD